MTKLGQTELVEAVEAELVTFLNNGTINERALTSGLDFTDLNINDFDRLKRIHYCLAEPVLDFVRRLPRRLRRIKTENQREQVITQGEVRGRIDWSQTTKLRYSEHYGDRTRFACESPYTEYDLSKNLVLKKLLWVINETVENDLTQLDFEWRTARWDSELVGEFQRLYSRNVHLNRIKPGPDITVTSRDLNATRSARSELYYQAYELYDLYERLLANDYGSSDVSSILQDTLVVPERIPRLFELYCIFQFVKSFDPYPDLELQIIEPGADALARYEGGGRRVEIFHDRVGHLDFHVGLDEIEEATGDYYRRHRKTIENHRDLLKSFIDVDSQEAVYSGRPDIVIEVYDTTGAADELIGVHLGEIKYTESSQVFSRGLRELVEYMEFVQSDTAYLDTTDVEVTGTIITDGVITTSTPDASPIQHVVASELTTEDLGGDLLRECLRR